MMESSSKSQNLLTDSKLNSNIALDKKCRDYKRMDSTASENHLKVVISNNLKFLKHCIKAETKVQRTL